MDIFLIVLKENNMSWWNGKNDSDTENEWRDTMKEKGLDKDERGIECSKNYKAVTGMDARELKDAYNISGKGIKEVFTNSQRDNNQSLKIEQIKEVQEKGHDNKKEVKDDLQNVREDTNRWRLW